MAKGKAAAANVAAENTEGAQAETTEQALVASTSTDAPGDDAEAVMQRRLDRLTNIVADSEFESGTALGDLTECVVDLFKNRPKLWSAMSNGEQRDLVRHVELTAKDILRKVVTVIATSDSHFIEATFLGQFAIKGETIEAKLKIEHSDEDTVISAYRLAGHRVVLISADDKRFAGKRRDVETQPDQLGMAFADEKPKAPPTAEAPGEPEHPDDDSDLSGESGDDDEGPFVIFDPSESLFLSVDDQGEGWAEVATDAKTFDDRALADQVAERLQAEVRELAEFRTEAA